MGRHALEPGQHSPIATTAWRVRADGIKERAGNARQATMWRSRCRFRKLDGTYLDLTRWAPTQKDAKVRIDAAIADLKVGGDDAVVKPSTPFVKAGEVWLEILRRPESGKSDNTLKAYEGAWKRYIVAKGSPLAGRSLSGANDVQRIEQLLRDVRDQHGPGSAKMTRSVLSGLFGWAAKRGVLDRNAVRSLDPVRRRRSDEDDRPRAMTLAERDHAVAVASEWAAREVSGPGGSQRARRTRQTVADLIAFLAGTGVRISEARMLKWKDVDLSAETVVIRGTKTASSVRSLNLPDWLKDRLTARKDAHGSSGYVFASVEGHGTPLDVSNLADSVRTVLDLAGLDWATSHTFRRTVATVLHSHGTKLTDIADQLGHANPTMTADRYLGRDLRGDKKHLADLL